MKWIILFLVINVNILTAAAVYRVWFPPEALKVIDPIEQKALALHSDHIMMENQHIILSKQNTALFKQLTHCMGRAI